MDENHQRLDFYLWCARIAASRADCAAIAASGLVWINRQATEKPHAKVRIGDVLTIPQGDRVRVLRVRGVAARQCGSGTGII
jgi:ribosome-associated heat shock protein Hsp15